MNKLGIAILVWCISLNLFADENYDKYCKFISNDKEMYCIVNVGMLLARPDIFNKRRVALSGFAYRSGSYLYFTDFSEAITVESNFYVAAKYDVNRLSDDVEIIKENSKKIVLEVFGTYSAETDNMSLPFAQGEIQSIELIR